MNPRQVLVQRILARQNVAWDGQVFTNQAQVRNYFLSKFKRNKTKYNQHVRNHPEFWGQVSQLPSLAPFIVPDQGPTPISTPTQWI